LSYAPLNFGIANIGRESYYKKFKWNSREIRAGKEFKAQDSIRYIFVKTMPGKPWKVSKPKTFTSVLFDDIIKKEMLRKIELRE
jgi:hypothetical protein